MPSAFSWIKADETAKDALVRVLTDRPLVVLPPPLHRMPLRVGNVVEIVGPSPSFKTLILIQAAISYILPKEWKGVQYGGMERGVLFLDLDCRFDVLSLSQALERRIVGANALRSSTRRSENDCDRELFDACMKRFSYTRCYNSSEFLATLKTLHYLIQTEKENQGTSVYMLMIDRWVGAVLCLNLVSTFRKTFYKYCIGAFYWMDRALTVPSSSTSSKNRKNFSLQSVAEIIVQEIKRLQLLHPMLVLASKSAASGDKQSTMKRNSDNQALDSRGPANLISRDHMPSVWKSFVSHRVLLHPSGCQGKHQKHPTLVTEWLLPPLQFSDKFALNEDGEIVILPRLDQFKLGV